MSQFRISAGIYVFLLLSIVVFGILGWFIVKPHPDLLRCNSTQVDKQYYQVNFNLNYATQLDALFPLPYMDGASRNTSSITGQFFMEWSNLPYRDKTRETRIRILDVDLKQPGSSALQFANQSIIEMRVQMDDSCGLTISSTPAVTGDVEKLISRLLSLFTYHVPEHYSAKWQAEHEDGIGSYLAEYQLVSHDPYEQIISRKRERYLSQSIENKEQEFTPRIIESASVGQFIPGQPWFHSLEGVEDISLLHSGRAVVQTRVSFTVKQMDNRFKWQGGTSVKTTTDQLPAVESSEPNTTDKNKDFNARSMTLESQDYATTLATYREKLLTSSVSAALDFLVSSLQKNPDLAYLIQQQILSESLGSKGEPLAFLALGKSGTDQAFGVLIELLEVPDASPITKSRAVYALAAARPASMEVVQILAMQLDRAGVDQDLASQSALMAMGMMSSKIEDEYDPTKVQLRELIGNQLSDANNEQSLRTALAASANADDEQLYPLVLQQLEHSSPAIRQRVVEVIGKTGPLSFRSELTEHFSNERDTGVKTASLDSLTTLLSKHKSQASETEVSMIAKAMKSEGNDQVRAAIIRFLGAQPENSEARKVLVEQVRFERNPALLKQLGQILTPEELMSTEHDH